MIQRNSSEIIEFFCSLWNSQPDIEIIDKGVDRVRVRVSQMYTFVPLSYKTLHAIATFFGTQDVSEERFAQDGCDTCDYGSSYQLTFIIRP